MDALLYFALWAGLIFLVMRFGCGAHVMGHRHGKEVGSGTRRSSGGLSDVPRWIPPKTEVDPVCGRTVDTAAAKSSVHDGWVYYFCSAECRERFEVNPETYLREGEPPPRARLEHSHG